MKKTYTPPVVMTITDKELDQAYYGAMASSCCQSGQRCG
jgi:hypothetical protein